MQQDPSVPTTASSAVSSSVSNNRLLVGLGVGALAIAGAVGLAFWLGGQPKIKRKRAAKNAGAAAGAKGAAKAKVGPGGKKPMVRADDAKITLEKAAKMTIEEIQNGLEQAEREGDKASQINILFLLASSLLQQEQLEKQHIEAAVQYYNIALQFAEEINSEMLGPILLELAVLSFNFKNYPQAMALFEQGLLNFIETPEEEVEATNTKHILSLFVMLTECYFNTKQHQRGIEFLLNYLKRTEGRKEHADLFPSLMLSVGEFTYALKDYPACIDYLEQGLARAEGTDLPPDLAMLYNYYLAWGNVKAERNEQAVKYLERYLDAAKVAKAPVESTLESIMSLVICYKEQGQLDAAVKTVDRALQALKQIDEAEHPLLCLKQFYFLGLYCLNKLEQLDRARDLLERAYQLAKSNSTLSKEMPWGTIAIDLAEAYHKLKMRQEALKMIETGLTALRERDTSLVPPALIRQAKIYSEMGDKATAVRALEEALQVAEELKKKESATAGDAELGSGWLCRFLRFQMGKMFTLMGQLSKADALLTEAFGTFVGTTDLEIRTVVLATIASNLIQAGQKEAGLKKIQEVLDVLATPTTQKLNQGDIRTELGECYLFLGDYVKAKQELESALEQFAKEKNEKSELLVLVRLAAIHDWLGEVERALECLALAEKAKERDSSVIHLGSVGVGYALHHLTVGDIAKAQAQADQTAAYVDPACCGATPLNVLTFNGLLAETNFWSNRMEASIQHFQRCLQHIAAFPYARENIVTILNVQTRLAALSLYTENRDQDANALAMLGQLLPLARTRGSLHHVAQLLALTGLAKARALDNAEAEAEAAALFAEALSVAEETADCRTLAFVSRLAGAFYTRHAAADKADEGRKHLDQALSLARQLGDQLLEAVVLRDLAIVAVNEQTGSDEDKAHTWKEATAGALAIAERTGNAYLVNLLAHLPGQAPAAASLPLEPLVVEQTTTETAPAAPVEAAEEVKPEEKQPEVVAEVIPQTEEKEETKSYTDVVQEAEAEEEAKEEAKQEEQESRTEEESDTKSYAEVLQEANEEEAKAEAEAEEKKEEEENSTKSYAEVLQEANEEEAKVEAEEEEKKEEETSAQTEEESETKSFADVVAEAEEKVVIEDVAEDEHDE